MTSKFKDKVEIVTHNEHSSAMYITVALVSVLSVLLFLLSFRQRINTQLRCRHLFDEHRRSLSDRHDLFLADHAKKQVNKVCLQIDLVIYGQTAQLVQDKLISQYSDILAMCCTSNIIFCNMCCFRSASSGMSSLKAFFQVITRW